MDARRHLSRHTAPGAGVFWHCVFVGKTRVSGPETNPRNRYINCSQHLHARDEWGRREHRTQNRKMRFRLRIPHLASGCVPVGKRPKSLNTLVRGLAVHCPVALTLNKVADCPTIGVHLTCLSDHGSEMIHLRSSRFTEEVLLYPDRFDNSPFRTRRRTSVHISIVAYTPPASLSEMGNRGSAAIALTDNTAQFWAAFFDLRSQIPLRSRLRQRIQGEGPEDPRRRGPSPGSADARLPPSTPATTARSSASARQGVVRRDHRDDREPLAWNHHLEAGDKGDQ